MNIEPRYLGKLRLPGQSRSFRLSNRSRFAAIVETQFGASARFFGFLKIKIFGKTQFQLSAHSATRDAVRLSVLRLYVHKNFPYFSFSNKGGTAKVCFMVFSGKIFLDMMVNFNLQQKSIEGSKVFNIGFLSGCAQKQKSVVSQGRLDQLITDLKERRKSGVLSDLEFSQFMSELQSMIFPSDHRKKYREASILINAAAHVNHRVARSQLLKLNGYFKNAGLTDLGDAFLAEVNAMTAPQVLGTHGYRLPMEAISLDQILSELHPVMQQLSYMGVQPCIACGTLLGFVRDGRLLPHDDDIDLSLLVRGESLGEVVSNWKRLMDRILDEMPAFRKEGFVAIEMPCGVEVDLFPMWVQDGKVFAYPYLFGDFNEDQFFPLVARDWAGFQVNTPAILEPVLELNYGPKWKVHDPFWKFDWKIARRRFEEFLRLIMN